MKQEVPITKCPGSILTDIIISPSGGECVLIFGDLFTCVRLEPSTGVSDEFAAALDKGESELGPLFEKHEKEAAEKRAAREKEEYLRLKKIYGKKLTKS